MKLEIRRLGYSRAPWRLVDADRQEFGQPVEIAVPVVIEHPTIGRTVIDEAVSGDTQRECVRQALNLLGRLMEQRVKERTT